VIVSRPAFIPTLPGSPLPNALDQENDCVRFDAVQGIIPPYFILDATIGLIEELARSPATESILVKSIAERTAERSITGDYS
jgi:uncharacterized protein (DUF885 family)